MSEEFLRVATKEVSDDIAEIGNLLSNCSNDSDISKNASDVEKLAHKLKGLAPMMGHEEIGEIASTVDALLKLLISGKQLPGIFQAMTKSHQFMSDAINDDKSGYLSLKNDLDDKYSAFLGRK